MDIIAGRPGVSSSGLIHFLSLTFDASSVIAYIFCFYKKDLGQSSTRRLSNMLVVDLISVYNLELPIKIMSKLTLPRR